MSGPRNTATREGRESLVCRSLLLPIYGSVSHPAIRSLLRRLVLRLEGGPVYSLTIREIYQRFHGVTVGLYTIGPCDVAPGNLAPGTTVGRSSSIYYTVQTITHDPSASSGSSESLGEQLRLNATSAPACQTNLKIGNDVWIGHNAIILPDVTEIGDGAVVGAGSVVRANVPPYAIVTGNPARVVRYRFSEQRIKELCESKWWLKGIDELGEEIEGFQVPLEGRQGALKSESEPRPQHSAGVVAGS